MADETPKTDAAVKALYQPDESAVDPAAELVALARRMEAALRRIADWPDGGARYGQARIKQFARAALAGKRL